jgi:hypothetical protein
MKNTALHGALQCETARECTVRLLTQTAPEVALAKNRYGETPLSLACHRYMRIRGHRRDRATVNQVWRIVVMLMRAAYYGYDCDNPTKSPALHAALSLHVPLDIVMAALDCFPEQAVMPDRDGRYALWSAIQTPRAPAQKREIILQTLQLFPDAARHPQKDGRMALSLAADAEGTGGEVLRKLWRANPDAGKQLDPLYKIYPFQVAALPKKITTDSSKGRGDDEELELNQLSAIFELLLAEPSLLLPPKRDPDTQSLM